MGQWGGCTALHQMQGEMGKKKGLCYVLWEQAPLVKMNYNVNCDNFVSEKNKLNKETE